MRRVGAPVVALSALVAGLILGPFLDQYSLYVLVLALIYVVFATGYNVLLGCAGQLDFGQAAFLGIGAYAVGLLQRVGVSFWAALPTAGIVTALVGLAIGAIVLRLKGFYLALVTLGFNQTVVLLLSLGGSFTGGFQGIDVDRPELFGLSENLGLFYIVLVVSIAMVWFAVNVLASRIGLAFFALRDNDIAAQSMGITLTWFRVMAYGMSAFYGGIAGGLMAIALSYITPDGFGMTETLKALTMITVGGMGSVAGAAIGAIALTVASEALRFSANYMEIANGLLLVLSIMFMPAGIYGVFVRLVRPAIAE